jgi:hypothetical protein
MQKASTVCYQECKWTERNLLCERRLMDLWEKCVRPDQYQIESMMKYQEVLKKFEREKEAFELAQKTNMVMAKQPQNINLFTLHLSFLNK